MADWSRFLRKVYVRNSYKRARKSQVRLRNLETLENRVLLSGHTVYEHQTVIDLSAGIPPEDLKTEGSIPDDFFLFGGLQFFTANDVSHGRELWITDGTSAGTRLFKDINPGSGHAIAGSARLTAWGNKFVFTADDGVHGNEVWISDGTADGTRLLKDIHVGNASQGSSARWFTVGGDGKLYFAADDGIHGEELWVSDGTTAGTRLVSDIRTGLSTSSIRSLTPSSRGIDFVANADGGTAGLLWTSNGTEAGTYLFADVSLLPGVDRVNAAQWFDVQGQRYVVVTDVYANTHLLRIGEASITRVDFAEATTYSNIQFFKIGNDLTFVAVNESLGRYELRKVTLASSGSSLVHAFPREFSATGSLPNSQSVSLVGTVGSRTLFSHHRIGMYAPATSGSFLEIWSVNSSLTSTDKLASEATSWIQPVATATPTSPITLVSNKGKVYQTDGTIAGTTLVNSNAGDLFYTRHFRRVGNRILFVNETATSGSELWSGTTTLTGSAILKDINAAAKFVQYNGSPAGDWHTIEPPFGSGQETWTFFTADHVGSADVLMVTAAAPEQEIGAHVVRDPQGNIIYGADILAKVGRQIFFRVGSRLWVTDAPTSSTTLNSIVGREVRVGTGQSLVIDFGAFQDWVSFPAVNSFGGSYTAFLMLDVDNVLWSLTTTIVGGSQPSDQYTTFSANKLNNGNPIGLAALMNEAVVVGNAIYFMAVEPKPGGGTQWAIYSTNASTVTRLTEVATLNRPQLSYAVDRLFLNTDPVTAGVYSLRAVTLSGSVTTVRSNFLMQDLVAFRERVSSTITRDVAIIKGLDQSTGIPRLYRYYNGSLTQLSTLEVVSELEYSSYYGGIYFVGRDAAGKEAIYRFESNGATSPTYSAARISDYYTSVSSDSQGRLIAVGGMVFALQQTPDGIALGVVHPYATSASANKKFPRPIKLLAPLGMGNYSNGVRSRMTVIGNVAGGELLLFERSSEETGRELWLTNGWTVIPIAESKVGGGDRQLSSFSYARGLGTGPLYVSYFETPQLIESIPLPTSLGLEPTTYNVAPGGRVPLYDAGAHLFSSGGAMVRTYRTVLRALDGTEVASTSSSYPYSANPTLDSGFLVPSSVTPGEYTLSLEVSYSISGTTYIEGEFKFYDLRVYPAVRLQFQQSGTEGETVTGRVYMNQPLAYPIDVIIGEHQYYVSSASSSDYRFLGGAIHIPAGATEAFFTVQLIDDDIYEGKSRVYQSVYDINPGVDPYTEGQERVYFAIHANPDPANGRYGVLGDSAYLTILDNDTPPTLSISTSAVSETLAEDAGEVAVTFTLSSPAGIDTPVELSLTGSATSGTDYQIPQQIIIPKGSTSVTVPLKIINDEFAENAESIFISIQESADGDFVLAPATSSLQFTISKNDASYFSFLAPWQQVRDITNNQYMYNLKAKLTTANFEWVTVPVTLGGNAVEGVDYDLLGLPQFVFSPGAREASIQIRIRDVSENRRIELVAAPTGNVQLGTFGAQTLEIVNNSNVITLAGERNIKVFENTQNHVVRVDLSTSDHPGLTIPLVFSGSAVMGEDYNPSHTSIFIPAGQSSGEITIDFIDDDILPNPYGTHERTLIVSLGSIPANFKAGIATQFIGIQDNDPVVTLADLSPVDITEGQFADITVQLTGPTNVDVIVPLETVYGAGMDASEVNVPSQVVIPAGQISATYRVTAINDLTDDTFAVEWLTVTLGTPNVGVLNTPYSYRSPTKKIQVRDLQSPPKAYWPRDSYSATEGKTATLEVRLTYASETTIKASLTYSGSAAGSSPVFSGPSSVTFLPGETVKKIKITTVDNTQINSTRQLVITLGGGSVAANNAVTTLHILDDDAPPPPPPVPVLPPPQPQQPPKPTPPPAGPGGLAIETTPIDVSQIPPIKGPIASPSTNDNTEVLISTPPGGLAIGISEAGLLAGASYFFDFNKNGIRDFLDINQNGQRDQDEPVDPVFQTGADGRTLLSVPLEADRNGDGYVDSSEGQWVIEGGVDTSTGLQKNIRFVAPVTFYVVSSTSTFINSYVNAHGLTLPAAVQSYFEAFGLPYISGLETHEILRSASQGNAELLRFFQVDTQLYVIANILAEVITAAEPNYTIQAVADAVFRQLSASTLNVEGAQIRLNEPTYLSGLIGSLTDSLAVPLSSDVISALTQSLARINGSIAAVDSPTASGVENIVRIQKVALTEVTVHLTQIVAGTQTLAGLQAYLQNNFDSAVASAITLNIEPVYLDIDDVYVVEAVGGGHSAVFTVRPYGVPQAPFSVNYFTHGETATPGQDYTHVTGTVSWSAGDTTPKTISVPILGQVETEDLETFKLYLTSPQNAALIRSAATGTIEDADLNRPDFAGTVHQLSPSAPRVSNVVDVEYEVNNQGLVDGTTTAHFYLQKQGTEPGTGLLLGTSGPFDLLATTGSGLLTTQVTLPSRTHEFWEAVGGTYTIVMILDQDDTVLEVSETNNVAASGPFDVEIPITETPSIQGLGSTVVFQEGTSPVVVAPSAVVTDPNSPHFNGGTLLIQITANRDSADVLSIRNVGTGAGEINTSGNQVRLGSIVLGTFSGGTGNNSLSIVLNSQATPARVQELLRNIVFSNPSNGLSPLARTITVTVGDEQGNVSDPVTQTIDIITVNDRPTDLLLSSSSVPENQPVGTTVGTLTAVDPDVGDTFTYELVNGSGADDNARFTIVGNVLKTAEVFRYSTQSSFRIRVRVTDAAGTKLERVFTITVISLNTRPTAVVISTSSVRESRPVGTTVGTLSAVDPDVGDTHTYELVGGAGSDNNSSFTIEGNQLKTAEVFHYYAKNSYKIRVRVTDAAGTKAETVLTISIIHVNNRPTNLTLTPPSVDENKAPGATVGTFTAEDPDVGDTFTYELVSGAGDDDNALFEIDGNKLKTLERFNYEQDSLKKIRVQVTDAAGTKLVRVFNISILDTNDRPTGLQISSSTLLRNQPVGTVVGLLTATDVDAVDSFTYELVSGTGSSENDKFAIDGNRLVTAAVFDGTSSTTNYVRVRVTDSGGLRYEKIFKIRLINNRPTTLILSSNTVTPDAPLETVVGEFSSNDPDAGEILTYTLVPGAGSTDNASFSIIGNQLRTATLFNSATKSIFSIRVRVTDSGGAKFEAIFQIHLSSVT